MLHPKEFLLQECENVRSLLRNTLRYAYSAKSSEQVYAECNSRLELIESRLKSKVISQADQFQELHDQLSQLGKLIGRVERSHIEEFAWPFAQALQQLATEVCGKAASTSENAEPSTPKRLTDHDGTDDTGVGPLFFISADDELSSYSVITEQTEAGFIDQPLFNIIFPRSLKHYVLLHPILGHEVGHAALEVHTAALDADVIQTLTIGSPLDDRNKFKKWISGTGQSLDSDLIDEAVMQWPEELYCDLFGLLLMGPSFIGANCSLLQPFDVKGVSDSHPPSLTRYVMLEHAVEALHWRSIAGAGVSRLKQPVNSYFECLTGLSKTAPRKFHLLLPSQIHKAVEKLAKFLLPMGDALYEMPKAKSLARMVDRLIAERPPVESTISTSFKISNEAVDIRTILFAGWLAWHSKKLTSPLLDFPTLNLLCDRGVLQQTAVDHWMNNLTTWNAKHVSN